MALLFGAVGPVHPDTLGRLEQLRRDDLQMRKYLGTAFPAAEYARIGQIAEDTPDRGVVPHFARPCPVAQLIYVGNNSVAHMKIRP